MVAKHTKRRDAYMAYGRVTGKRFFPFFEMAWHTLTLWANILEQ
jgi:hypothetical protein